MEKIKMYTVRVYRGMSSEVIISTNKFGEAYSKYMNTNTNGPRDSKHFFVDEYITYPNGEKEHLTYSYDYDDLVHVYEEMKTIYISKNWEKFVEFTNQHNRF